MLKLAKVRAVKDSETLSMGTLKITAHLTPGRAPVAPPGAGAPAARKVAMTWCSWTV
jgi:hypothetical protein